MGQSNNFFQLPIGGKPEGFEEEKKEDAVSLTAKPRREGALLAPSPLVDRYPTIVGSSLSLSYLSATYRLALTGYRREYVDALSELIERDPHLYAVLMQRVLTACGARITLLPRDKNSKRCRKLAQDVQKIVDNIHGFRQALATLAFSGFYYGIGGCEIAWEPIQRRTRGNARTCWVPTSLNFIHSRRLSFPDPSSWDLRIWDQGNVSMDRQSMSQTAGIYGLRVADYPGKFVTFAPQLHADYPTREGVGRIVAFWSALKTMGARGAAQYVERYAKPWALATYATTSTGIPRAAEASAANNDVGAANQALAALGTGALAGAVIPDSIKVNLQQITGSRSNIGHKDWIDICNREISKGVLGQTDTTDGGGAGSRARAQVQKQGSNQIARLDVMLLADCFQTGLIDWIVRYNWPNDFDKRPFFAFSVDPEPDPYGVVKLASMFASAGAPVDADEIARTIGVKLVDPGDKKCRPLVPVKPVDAHDLYPDLLAPPKEGSSTTDGTSNTPSGKSVVDDGTDEEEDGDSSDEEDDDEEDSSDEEDDDEDEDGE